MTWGQKSVNKKSPPWKNNGAAGLTIEGGSREVLGARSFRRGGCARKVLVEVEVAVVMLLVVMIVRLVVMTVMVVRLARVKQSLVDLVHAGPKGLRDVAPLT